MRGVEWLPESTLLLLSRPDKKTVMLTNFTSNQNINCTPATILVIDDNPTTLGVAVNSLEDRGFTVLTARDGVSGIKRAKYAHPDLILLDVIMSGIDGFETCRQLKTDAETQAIPVIFMTALTSSEEKVKGFEVGAVDYVTKPIQIEEVIARVNLHLKLHFINQELHSFNCTHS